MKIQLDMEPTKIQLELKPDTITIKVNMWQGVLTTKNFEGPDSYRQMLKQMIILYMKPSFLNKP